MSRRGAQKLIDKRFPWFSGLLDDVARENGKKVTWVNVKRCWDALACEVHHAYK